MSSSSLQRRLVSSLFRSVSQRKLATDKAFIDVNVSKNPSPVDSKDQKEVQDLQISVKRKEEPFIQKAVRVSVLGGDTRVGDYLAFLLKQNPIVSHIYLHGKFGSMGTVADLSHIDTRSFISAYTEADVDKSVRCADIIVICGTEQEHIISNIPDKVAAEITRVAHLAEVCCKTSPKALVIVNVCPISVMLPLVSNIYRKTHWYHPGRVIGSVALHQIRANSILARFYDLDPDSVYVPLAGGPEPDCMVPLFSRARPIGVPMADAKHLTAKFRGVKKLRDSDKIVACQCRNENAPLAEAYALNRMITAMALGICGDRESLAAAFVRSNIISNCKHLTSVCRFGQQGMNHNYGLPHLSPLELRLFERATILLRKRERMADFYLDQLANVRRYERRGAQALGTDNALVLDMADDASVTKEEIEMFACI